MFNGTSFQGILSSSANLEAQTLMIHATITKMLEIAKLLLCPFLLVRLIVHYFQYHLHTAELLKACYTSVLTLFVTFLLLHFYVDIFNILDKMTAVIMKQFYWRDLFKATTILENKGVDLNIWEMVKNGFSNISTGIFKSLANLMGTVTTYFRHQAIIFALQVGPLAIAASLLPGNFSQIVSYWLNMLIAFLMWGVTIDLLDYSLCSLELKNIDGIASAISSCLLYGMIGPLTSLYIGNTVGNSLFALGEAKTTQFFSYGANFLLKEKK